MTMAEKILAKRRGLLLAIYALQADPPQIRIDEQLAQNLERAWDDYDAAIRAQVLAELEAAHRAGRR